MKDNELRETICMMAKALISRGLTHGSTGDISAPFDDSGLLLSPTGTSFCRLYPAKRSTFNSFGRQIGGDRPIKELPLHSAFYETRSSARAVVHLHSCYSLALSKLSNIDADNFLPSLTPYGIMQLGKVTLLPYFLLGDPAIGKADRGLAGKRSAVMLANHRPVVAGKDIEAACAAIEELEDTAKLAILIREFKPNGLSRQDVETLVDGFNVEWDE